MSEAMGIGQLRIVVEGFDGSGKSTLIANLGKYFNDLGVSCQVVGRRGAAATPAIAAMTESILKWDAGLEYVEPDENAHTRLARAQARVDLAAASAADVILFDRWLPSDLSRLQIETQRRFASEAAALHRDAAIGLTVYLSAPYGMHWERISGRPLEEWSPTELLGRDHMRDVFKRYVEVWESTWREPRFVIDATKSPDQVLRTVAHTVAKSMQAERAS